MSRWRGSKQRRMRLRQKRARWTERYATKEVKDREADRREKRMWGNTKPKVKGYHPLERKR